MSHHPSLRSGREEQLRFLQCPTCRTGTLRTVESGSGVACPQCHALYPLVNGVLHFIASEHYTGSFGMQWNIHRRTQLDSRTGLSLSRDRLFNVSRWPSDLRGQTILEAGSGAGRFTEILLNTGAQVLSFDLSSAVDANSANNGSHQNLLLFRADIFNIPVQPLSVDKVLCLGVLQHTPDPAAAFKSLAKHVRPGGELVIDVYAASLRSLLAWKYLLRPITTRMNKEHLYRVIAKITPPLVPLSAALRRLMGRTGPRLLPILQYAHWGLPPELNREWAILDTFDMYSPAHDHPQTIATVRQWYREAAFVDVTVGYGPNGVIGRGRRPASA